MLDLPKNSETIMKMINKSDHEKEEVINFSAKFLL